MDILGFLLEHSPALIVAVPLFGAFLTPLISMVNEKLRNIFVIIVLGFTGFLISLLANDVMINGNIHTYVFGGNTEATINSIAQGVPLVRILFEVDALGVFMAIIAIIVAFVASIYSWSYMKNNTALDKYYTLLLLMTTGMLGLVLTGDMFNFFVFLEITSIASCALIAFWSNKGEPVEAAFKYIVISSIGALFVLFAVALFYGQYNALNMAVIANSLQYTMLDKIALVILIGALAMKAGIVPMHMWLPDSYSKAPASVTLVLVGATQASLYGVFRVCFTIYGDVFKGAGIGDISPGWLLVILGLITMGVGVLMALIQSDFKRLIAYGAVAELGYMFMAIGAGLAVINQPEVIATGVHVQAITGGVFHIINDALDVGLLFLVAGAVYLATKKTNMDQLGGLARNMKYTSIFFIIGLLAVAGMPPMNGFVSKLLIYESTFQINPMLAIIAILSSILLLAIFVKVFHSVFLGPVIPQLKEVKEAPKAMLIAMGILAGLIIFFGLFPNIIIENLVEPAVNALINNQGYISQVITTAGGGI